MNFVAKQFRSDSELRLMRSAPRSPTEAGYAPLGPQETLYFLHIEKTAGTSVKAWLINQFPQEETLTYPSPETLSQEPTEVVEGKRLLVAHFEVNWWQHYRRPDRVITWLRNPVERTFSEYYFFRDPSTELPLGSRAVKLAKTLALEPCLSNHEFQRLRSNVQARALSVGTHNPERFFLSAAERTSRALATLQSADFFGIVEQMQASVDMLNWRYGWRPRLFDLRDNPTRNRPQQSQISPQAREIAEQMNLADQELYDNACEIFRRRFLGFLAEVVELANHLRQPLESADELASLPYAEVRQRIEPLLWRRFRWATQDTPRHRELTYTFDLPLHGEGWAERAGRKSLAYLTQRWTRRKHAQLDLPLQRDVPLLFRFRVAHTLGQKLDVLANGELLSLRQLPTWESDGVHDMVFEAELPVSDDWEQRLTTITFAVDELRRPCDVNRKWKDQRSLGVCFDWIQVCPAT